MSKVSIIIPACEEIFLNKTINDLLTKAAGEVEVIAVLDGYWPEEKHGGMPDDDKRLILVHHSNQRGMRAGINDGAAVATGDYLMKCDAHCMFQEGYDEILKAECDDNWVVIPARYSLDAENWAIDKNGKPRRDYHYLCFPHPNKPHDAGMHGVEWWARGKERSDPKYDVDENMSFQGSCWFMSRKHWNWLGGMSEVGYGKFTQEPQEVGLKTWLGGGKVMVNKKCWYAHLHKGSHYGRMWPNHSQMGVAEGHLYSAKYWMTNSWAERVHDLEWLIERFAPVPTWDGDEGDWRSKFKLWHEHYGV